MSNALCQKVSVIIPTYNAEKWVARCLESVTGQTLREIEILIIDDGSQDHTVQIVGGFARKDARITLVTLPTNQGAAVARNTGIERSTGEYIGFVDADDYIDQDFYEKLYTQAKFGGADIVAGNVIEKHLNGDETRHDGLIKKFKTSKFNFQYTLWIAIYKSSFIKDNVIDNPVGIITGQDTVFCIKCACLANKIDVVLDTYYHYVRISNSLSSEVVTRERLCSKIAAVEMSLDFVNSKNLSESEYNNAVFDLYMLTCKDLFYKNTKRDVRIYLLSESIRIFNKYKYKDHIREKDIDIYKYIMSDDFEGLYEYLLLNDSNSCTCIKLFGLPFVRIYRDYGKHKVRVKIFGISVLTIYTIK